METSDDPLEPAAACSDLRVREFDSFAAVEPFWLELNRTYKQGELTVDLSTHELIWRTFHEPRGYELKIHVAFAGETCVGIFPLLRTSRDAYGTTCWSLTDDFVVAREYFCEPRWLPAAADRLPPHLADDLSCFYAPADHPRLASAPGGVIDIKASEEEYLASLSKSHRSNLRRVLRHNEDVRVEADTRLRPAAVEQLLPSYLRRWRLKDGCPDLTYYRYCQDKIHCDLALMARAEELGKLVALYLFAGDQLLAANFAVRRERDRVDDYMCLRDCDEQHRRRSVGVLAILRNMEHCRALGVVHYDLSACHAPYKTQFLNTAASYRYLRYDDLLAAAPAAPTAADAAATQLAGRA